VDLRSLNSLLSKFTHHLIKRQSKGANIRQKGGYYYAIHSPAQAGSFRGCRDIYVSAINTGFARIYA